MHPVWGWHQDYLKADAVLTVVGQRTEGNLTRDVPSVWFS